MKNDPRVEVKSMQAGACETLDVCGKSYAIPASLPLDGVLHASKSNHTSGLLRKLA